MKPMTKRDVADIAIILPILTAIFVLIPTLLAGLAGFFLDSAPRSTQTLDGWRIQVVSTGLCCFGLILLVVYRMKFIGFLFPDCDEKVLEIPCQDARVFSSYSFWIRLFGLFFLIRTLLVFVSNLLFRFRGVGPIESILSLKNLLDPQVFSLVLCVLVIWKADLIGQWSQRLEKTSSPDPVAPVAPTE